MSAGSSSSSPSSMSSSWTGGGGGEYPDRVWNNILGVNVEGGGGSGTRNPSDNSLSEGPVIGVEVDTGSEETGEERGELGGLTGVSDCPGGARFDSMAAVGGAGDGEEVVVAFGAAAGLLESTDTKFLTLRTFSSGKIRKIQKREFIEMFNKGEYYPPEGATVFSEKTSSTFYVYGGARANKPGHWGMSNQLFKIKTCKVNTGSDNSANEIVSFEMINQSVSKTSSFCKLFGASGVTEYAKEEKLLCFTVNGKNIDCPSESRFVSNEIQIMETVSDTTFRTNIVRSGQDNVKIDKLKTREIVQYGDIPRPSYGACLVRVTAMDRGDVKVAVKIGGAVLANQHFSDLDVLFSNKPLWEEESSSEVHILRYNVSQKNFVWEKVEVPDLEPLAFHSAVVMGHYIYIFGGMNLTTKQRYSVSPQRICLLDWTLSHIQVEGLPGGCLAGAGLVAGGEHAYIVGGYCQQFATENDKPTDTFIQVTFQQG